MERTTAEVLKELRKAKKLTQAEAAKEIGMSTAALAMYETGARFPNAKLREKICEFYGIDMNYLFGKSLIKNSYHERDSILQIPIYNPLKYQNGQFDENALVETITVPDFLLDCSKKHFAIIIEGDSMIGSGIKEGDVAIFNSTDNINSGDIGCFAITKNKVVCKKYFADRDGKKLFSSNDMYPPIDVSDNQEYKCLGKLVLSLAKR